MKPFFIAIVLLAFIAAAADAGPMPLRCWRWRNDDGDVYKATWIDSMHCPVNSRIEGNIRLRMSLEFGETKVTPVTVTLRYGRAPYLQTYADSSNWRLITQNDTGMFFLSDSRYLTDGIWYPDNPMLSGWDSLHEASYSGTLTIDSSSNPVLQAVWTEGYEIEYCLKMNPNIPEGSVFYFLAFYDGQLQFNPDPPCIRTPPFYWDYYKKKTGGILKIQFVDELNGWCECANDLFAFPLMRTVDGGKTWRQAGDRSFFHSYFQFADKDTGWAFLGDRRLYKSTDGGSSWIPIECGVDSTTSVSVFSFSDARHGWAAFDDSSMIRTIDGGATWETLHPPKGVPDVLYFINEQTGFTCIRDPGELSAATKLYKTTDGGLTWQRIPFIDEPPFPANSVAQIQFADMERGWVRTNDGRIFQSTDGGEHWMQLRPASEPSMLSFAFSDRNNGWVVGNQGMILATKDGGATWEERPSGTGHDLQTIAAVNGHVWIGARDGTILSSPNGGWSPTAVDEENVSLVPQRCVLYPNYPNPFNPSTTIRYALPRASHVTLRIYDVLGREVATLIDDVKAGGIHEAIWSASRFPSGIYICRIEAGSYRHARMMALVK